jgi:hypothetical protein
MSVQPKIIGAKYMDGSRVTPMLLFITENSAYRGAGKITKIKI